MPVFGLDQLAPEPLARRAPVDQLDEALRAFDRGAGEVDAGEIGESERARQGGCRGSCGGEQSLPRAMPA